VSTSPFARPQTRATNVGDVYDRLTVVELLPSRRSKPGAKAKSYVLTRCECGRETEVSGSNLRSGAVRSCGCVRRATRQTLTAGPLLGLLERTGVDVGVEVAEVLQRARERGWVLFDWADEFCCKVLKLHPMSVWGDAYLTPERVVLGEVAAA